MQVRVKTVLDAERIETAEQAAVVHKVAVEEPVKARVAAVGDYIMTKPGGERFLWPGEEFDATYEAIDASATRAAFWERMRAPTPTPARGVAPALLASGAVVEGGALHTAGVLAACSRIVETGGVPGTLLVGHQNVVAAMCILNHRNYSGPRLHIHACDWLGALGAGPHRWYVAAVGAGLMREADVAPAREHWSEAAPPAPLKEGAVIDDQVLAAVPNDGSSIRFVDLVAKLLGSTHLLVAVEEAIERLTAPTGWLDRTADGVALRLTEENRVEIAAAVPFTAAIVSERPDGHGGTVTRFALTPLTTLQEKLSGGPLVASLAGLEDRLIGSGPLAHIAGLRADGPEPPTP